MSQNRVNAERRSPQKRRRKKRSAAPIIIALIAVILLAVAAILILLLQSRSNPSPAPLATAAPVQTMRDDQTAEPAETSYSPLTEMLGDDDDGEDDIPAGLHVEVTDLSINPNLSADWKNVLLLGTDDRDTESGARTDTMIICSVNVKTGSVKLTSVLRDLAVDYNLDGESSIYRINAAYFFGGPELAMKTINELFSLNIEDYVIVNFFGFQELAYRLGGVDIDITEAEMHAINQNVIEQCKIALRNGIDDSDMPIVELTQYGENTHLDGRQTLGYARIRKLDSDVSRTERQRIVLAALSEKLKGKDAMELVTLATSLFPYVQTNLQLEEILSIGTAILSKDVTIDSTYVPIRGTYQQEKRNGESMLYDCNFQENAAYLQKFIYGQ